MRLNLVWNPDICSSENGKYVRSISDDLVITCDEIMYATKSILLSYYFRTKRLKEALY